jgi:hypothetical protein
MTLYRECWGKKTTDQKAEEPGETINPLNAELNSICYLLALLGAHHFLHVSRIRVKQTSGRVRPERVNRWPNCMLGR